MSGLDWTKARRRGQAAEQAEPKGEAGAQGAWTHVKRSPVRVLTDEEKAELLRSRPDLLKPGS